MTYMTPLSIDNTYMRLTHDAVHNNFAQYDDRITCTVYAAYEQLRIIVERLFVDEWNTNLPKNIYDYRDWSCQLCEMPKIQADLVSVIAETVEHDMVNEDTSGRSKCIYVLTRSKGLQYLVSFRHPVVEVRDYKLNEFKELGIFYTLEY